MLARSTVCRFTRHLRSTPHSRPHIPASAAALTPAHHRPSRCLLLLPRRLFSSAPPTRSSAADAKIEELTELYNNARDEFEMAAEETGKATVYAAADRAAAREELDKLTAAFRAAVDSGGESGADSGGDGDSVAEEVRRRVGQRVRELESAVKAMEEAAAKGD